MNLDYKLILKIGAFTACSSLLIKEIKSLIKHINNHSKIQKQEIKNIDELEQLIKNNQKTQSVVLKLKPYYFQTLTQTIPIRTAQKIVYEPLDSKIVKKMIKKLSKKVKDQTKPSQILHQWYAASQMQAKYYKIYGFGLIQSDFFQIKREYKPSKNLSYWQRFENWVSQNYYRLLSPNKERVQNKHDLFSYTLGPVIGALIYDINLIKDTKIIALCNIEDGKIIPTVTASSKSEILGYFSNQICKKYLTVGCLSVITVFLGRVLFSQAKRYFNAISVRRQRVSLKYFNPKDADEDKMCIICYSNCRNIIFFDCRHMIMCQECSEAYESDVCPYCKVEIDEIKMVNGEQ